MSHKNRMSRSFVSFLSRALRTLGTLSALVLLALPNQASADNAALLKLFEILKAKGSISQEEYDQLVAVAKESDKAEARAPAPAPAATPPAAPSERLEQIEARLAESEAEMRALDNRIAASQKSLAELDKLSAETPKELMEKMLDGKWYENLSFRGYTQFRMTSVLGEHNPSLHVPNDRSVNDFETFTIRRGRLILSGDVTDHLSIYAQTDFAGSTGGGGDFVLALRDLYADISLDPAKEFRFRVGQSKVPFGFSNMQSSQNRLPMERPDALNSAVEGERDIGAFFYWAPKEKRDLYKKLVKDGLKGSGDYGVFGIGAYSGQGLNRSDANGKTHFVARLAYPFELENGQIMEVGVQGYTGSFVPSTGAIPGVGTPTLPNESLRDERVALSYILYPQPFGLEAEWTWGRGPQLSDDLTTIGVESLSGGYVLANYRIKSRHGVWHPFARYNHYDGGRKFGRNAPQDKVSEIDFGLEWSPIPELELTLMYTHTFERTNTNVAPYNEVTNADRIGLQLQWNF
ncbi:MAG TPA: porin [Prosthecobacter sp.]|nr:porin [Prosthecobacter sp.]